MPHPPQIPLTPQTDERNFPRWEKDAPRGHSGHSYPKMLTRPATSEDRASWIEKNKRFDANTRMEYWEDAPPRINAPIPRLSTQDMVDAGLARLANQPIVVQDAAEEQRVMEFLGLAEPNEPARNVSIPVRPVLDNWVNPNPPAKRKGRPPGAKNKPKLVTDVGS